MTQLRSQSQKYYLALNEAEEDVIDDAAARALPPITNALVLRECLPDDVFLKLRQRLPFLDGYVWFSEENVNRAVKCCLAAVVLIQRAKEYQFLIDQIASLHQQDIEMYDYDKALKAAQISGTGLLPQKYDDIPKQLPAFGRGGGYYQLAKKAFTWPEPVPGRVIDAVTNVAIHTDPDEFWIADYWFRHHATAVGGTGGSGDPIVYARYGNWHVEVARWD